jgi:lipopolysaccharide transport system ATP-binding protein
MSKSVNEKMSEAMGESEETVKMHEDLGIWKEGLDTPSLTNSSTHPPSPDLAIRVDHISKKFCRNLRKSMRYGMHDIGRNLLRMGTKPDKLRKDEFWAVDGVSFEVHRGETLGIIGPNGSGKSTILKMLNGIFMPDRGRIEINGRVGALIEVGAGFHPMLTGRENIYVNAAILGMTKEEVDEKFDDIIEFADIGDFIDTPVKHYSSGMYVRLGFAVAVHCEPDVLLVDEVLAVGDVGFRAKCYNKIAELMKNCAVVIVSHSLPIIGRMCTKCLVLNNSHSIFQGATGEAIQQYSSLFEEQKTNIHSSKVHLVNCIIHAKVENGRYIVTADDRLTMDLELESEVSLKEVILMLAFISSSGEFAAEWNSYVNGDCLTLRNGRQNFHISLYPLRLNPGTYDMSLIVSSENRIDTLLWIHHGWKFRMNGKRFGDASYQIEGTISSAEC